MKPSDNRALDELIKEHRMGSEGAFEELVRRFEPMFVNVARGLSLDVREVYSEACLSLRRAADSYAFGEKVTFGLYAKICVTRAMLDYMKRNKRRGDVADFDVDEVAVSDGVQSRLEREESIASFIGRARELLSPYEYDVFLLLMQGYSVSEIAARLERGVKSVENARARILKNLREGFGQIPEF